MNQHQHSIETTKPRHPVPQGVNAMRGIYGVGMTEHHSLRIPLDVCEDILGRPYSGTFADDQVIRTTLAVDPACPAWIRDSRHSFHDQTALVLLGPTLEQRQQQDEAVSTPEGSTDWRQHAFERLSELKAKTASMSVQELGKAMRDRLYLAIEVHNCDEPAYLFQTEELSRHGLNAIAAAMLLLEDFAYPDQEVESRDGHDEPEVAPVVQLSAGAPAAGNAGVALDIEGSLESCRTMLAFASQACGDRAEAPSHPIEGYEWGLSHLLDQVRGELRDVMKQVIGRRSA